MHDVAHRFSYNWLQEFISRLSLPTIRSSWSQWVVMVANCCHSWLRWWPVYFVSHTHKVMTALFIIVFVLVWLGLTQQLLQSVIVELSLQSRRYIGVGHISRGMFWFWMELAEQRYFQAARGGSIWLSYWQDSRETSDCGRGCIIQSSHIGGFGCGCSCCLCSFQGTDISAKRVCCVFSLYSIHSTCAIIPV